MSKQINIKQASEIINKSVHTIKKLILNNNIKSTKVQGKNGLEIRIDEDELKAFYNPANHPNNPTTFDPATPNIFYQGQVNSEVVEILRSENGSLKKDKEKLFKELETRSAELERMQKLLENQQVLSKGLQEQLQLTNPNFNSSKDNIGSNVSNAPESNKNSSNFNPNVKNEYVVVSDTKAPNISSKWWQIWK